MNSLPTITDEYWHLFGEGPMSMYILDGATMQFLTVNAAALTQYGYTREEFLALDLEAIQPEEEQDTFASSPAESPEMYDDDGRFRHRRKNGEIFYVHIYSHRTLFEGKAAKLILAIDVNEKEKAQEMENILDSITDAFYTVNHRWEFTHVNKAYEALLGRKREDMIGGNIWELFPYGKEFSYYERYHQVVKDQVSVHFEEYIPTNDMWVSVNAYPTLDGLAVYMVDISEQRRLREKIYSDEQNMRAIINNTSDLIWLVDLDFHIVSANRAFRDRMAGIMERATNSSTHPDYPAELFITWQAHYHRALEGAPFKIIWTDSHNGIDNFEEVSFNPVFDQQDKISAISCFSRDITVAKNDREQIEQQNKQLREIAWIQAHKVRAPLATIMGLANLFNTENPDISENGEIIEKLKRSSSILDNVIREILAQATAPENQ